MKLDAKWFGFAWAGAFSVTWLILGLFVMIMPMNMMNMGWMSADADFTGTHMNMGIPFFFTGLVWWAIIAGFTGWLIAVFYNKLL